MTTKNSFATCGAALDQLKATAIVKDFEIPSSHFMSPRHLKLTIQIWLWRGNRGSQ